MKILDLFFSCFRLYRKYRGGKWFKIAPSPANPSIGEFWIKGKPSSWESFSDFEDWP